MNQKIAENKVIFDHDTEANCESMGSRPCAPPTATVRASAKQQVAKLLTSKKCCLIRTLILKLSPPV